MSIDLSTLGVPAAPDTTGVGAGGNANARKAQQLAQEFESMLMLQMIRQMRQGMLEEESPDTGMGAATMTDTFDLEFSRYLGSVGGLGLANAVVGHLPKDAEQPSPLAGLAVDIATPLTVSGAAPVAYTSGSTPKPEASATPPETVGIGLPIEAPVSSAFGWRTDPFVGTRKFHGGIDLKAAYGRDVPTVAGGRVVFAGEQGGYGQTVVVEHGEGYRTRYAHLSSIAVTSGQEIAAGQLVGQVGQSGRATGPHLHFEVTRDGKTLDPAEVARTVSGEFKFQDRLPI